MGMGQQLVYLLQREEHEQSHEHLVKALLTLLRDNKPVIEEVVTAVKDLEDFVRARYVTLFTSPKLNKKDLSFNFYSLVFT